MEMMGIASQIFDEEGSGAFKLLPASKLSGRTRRVGRTKTLDGGVVLTDSGYSDGDRTLVGIVPYEENQWTLARHLIEECTWVVVSIDDGCYSAQINQVSVTAAGIRISILLKEKLS